MEQIMQEKRSVQPIKSVGCGCNVNPDVNTNTNSIRSFQPVNGVKASSAQPYIKVDKPPKNLIEEILATKKRGWG